MLEKQQQQNPGIDTQCLGETRPINKPPYVCSTMYLQVTRFPGRAVVTCTNFVAKKVTFVRIEWDLLF